MVELTIQIKGEDSTYTKKYLDYDGKLTLSQDCYELQKLVQEAAKEYKENVDVIVVKAKMIW